MSFDQVMRTVAGFEKQDQDAEYKQKLTDLTERADVLERETSSIPYPKPPKLIEPPKAEDYKTDPMKALGGAAGWLAIFGSLMTRRPLTNALRAASGVIESKKANDSKAYAAAFDQYKTELSNAKQMMEWERDYYDSQIDMQKVKAGQLKNEFSVLASSLKDRAGRQAAQAGLYGEFDKSKRAEELKLDNEIARLEGIQQKARELMIADGLDSESNQIPYHYLIKAEEEFNPREMGAVERARKTVVEYQKRKDQGETLTPYEQKEMDLAEIQAEGARDPLITEQRKREGRNLGDKFTEIENAAADSQIAMAEVDLTLNSINKIPGEFNNRLLGDLPAYTTEAQLLERAQVIDALRKVQLTKGAISEKENEMFLKASIGPNKTVGYNKTLLTIAKATIVRNQQRLKFFQEWKNLNQGSLEGAEAAFQKFANENPIFEITGTDAKMLKELPEIEADTTWRSYVGKRGELDKKSSNEFDNIKASLSKLTEEKRRAILERYPPEIRAKLQ